jgi:very-short-patch-repair endonuclease
MGGLVDCRKGLTRKESTSVRNRFDRKRIDFVLEERSSGDVLALVELDDRTHREAKDRARDEITNAAGYRTIRLRAGKRLDAKNVRDEISAALAPQLVAQAA